MDSTQIKKYKLEISKLIQEIDQLNERIEDNNSHTFLIIIGIIVLIGIIIMILMYILKRQRNLLQNDILNKFEDFKDLISKDNNRLLVPIFDGHEYLDLNQVIRIVADGRYSIFHFTNKKSLIISKNLGEFEKILDKNEFVRIHNSHIVNLKYIDRITKSDGGFVIMQNKTELPIAKSKRDNLNNLLKNGYNVLHR